MDFDAGGDPKKELYKWMQEYLRLKSDSWKEDEIQQAREHVRYFHEKLESQSKKTGPGTKPTPLPEGKEITKKPEPKPGPAGKNKKKPWPGWDRILYRL
jgi:hypothetical protein